MTLENGQYEVVWPRGAKVLQSMPYARRPDTLEGKTVCELWNWLFWGEKIFPMIEKEMTKRYPGVKFVNYGTFGATVGGAEAGDERKAIAGLPEKLRQAKCDVVISGVGG